MEFFFGKQINPDQEQEVIESVLMKYKAEKATEDLRKKIYADLVDLKESGLITIPFKVVMRKDIFDKHLPYIEIVLDTKV